MSIKIKKYIHDFHSRHPVASLVIVIVYLACTLGPFLLQFLSSIVSKEVSFDLFREMFSVLLLAIFNIIALAVYFLPTFVADVRQHRHFDAICMTNLLAGWLGIGWIVAMVWAVLKNSSD